MNQFIALALSLVFGISAFGSRAQADICSGIDNSQNFIRTRQIEKGRVRFEYCSRGDETKCERLGAKDSYDEITLQAQQNQLLKDAHTNERLSAMWQAATITLLIATMGKYKGSATSVSGVVQTGKQLGLSAGGLGLSAYSGVSAMEKMLSASLLEDGIRATWSKNPNQCEYFKTSADALKALLSQNLLQIDKQAPVAVPVAKIEDGVLKKEVDAQSIRSAAQQIRIEAAAGSF